MSPHGKISFRSFRPFRGDRRNAAAFFPFLPLVSSGLVFSSLGRYVRVTVVDNGGETRRNHAEIHVCLFAGQQEKSMTKAARSCAKEAGIERLYASICLILTDKTVNKPTAFVLPFLSNDKLTDRAAGAIIYQYSITKSYTCIGRIILRILVSGRGRNGFPPLRPSLRAS